MKFISADVSDMRILQLETYILLLCDGCAQPQKAVVIKHEGLVKSFGGVRVGVTSAQLQLGKQAWPLDMIGHSNWGRLVQGERLIIVKRRQPLGRRGIAARGALLVLLNQIR